MAKHVHGVRTGYSDGMALMPLIVMPQYKFQRIQHNNYQ